MTAKRKRNRKPSADPALRTSYLELYAARDARRRLTTIGTELGIRKETVDNWMLDPTFRDAIAEIDSKRLDAALQLATVAWPEIVAEQTRIALGELPDPPDFSGVDPEDTYTLRAMMEGHRAACAKRIQMSTRAAELIADLLGARKRQDTLVYNRVDTFGGLPDDLRGLVKENERLDRVLERAKKRIALEDKEKSDGTH